MAIGTSNITFSNIQTEFGGSNPISLDEYYAGLSYVPKGHTTGVTSGQISVGTFSGKSQCHNYITDGSQAYVDKYSSGTIYGWTGSGGVGSINNTAVYAYSTTDKYGNPYDVTYTWGYCYWNSAYNTLYLRISGNWTGTVNNWYIRVGNTVTAVNSFTRSYSGAPNYFTYFSLSLGTNPFTGTDNYRTRVTNYYTTYGEGE